MRDMMNREDLSLTGQFAEAGRVWRSNVGQFARLVLVIVVPVTILKMLGDHLDQSTYGELAWLSMLLRYGSSFLLVVAWIVSLLITSDSVQGEQRAPRAIFNDAGERYIPGAAAFLVAYAARTAGLAIVGIAATLVPGDSVLRSVILLLGVPLCAVALMMWVSLAPFLAVIEERPIGSAMHMSVRLAGAHWREVGGLLLLLTVLQGIVSLLVWFGGSAVDAWATQISMSSAFSFYGTSILKIAFLLPVRLIDDVTLLFALTVFAVYFINRRAVWERNENRTQEVDDGVAEYPEPQHDRNAE
ncbi:MAG: hypothetical protein RRA94_06775 [Bacteroidota bacterium]|nr:hypothetical protein [Bacteroidota bacterium]